VPPATRTEPTHRPARRPPTMLPARPGG
jgi:hypothetical protein